MSKPVQWAVLSAAVLMVAGIVGQSAAAQQGPRMFRAQLSGFEEVPSVFSTGSGQFSARLVQGGGALEYTLSYQALEGNTTTGAHIHLGQAGANGGVIVFLCGGAGTPDCPAVGGTVSGTIVPDNVLGPVGQGIAPGDFDRMIGSIRAGVAYVNVHSDKHPPGEIRGQVR